MLANVMNMEPEKPLTLLATIDTLLTVPWPILMDDGTIVKMKSGEVVLVTVIETSTLTDTDPLFPTIVIV
jgi:hypothetical protein